MTFSPSAVGLTPWDDRQMFVRESTPLVISTSL